MKTKNYNHFLKTFITGLVLFGVACSEVQAGEFYSKCSNIEKVLSDTLVIPFSTDWGGGGYGHPAPIYTPTFAQTYNQIVVFSSEPMVIPYRIYRDGVSTPKVQGFLYVAPPSNVVANTSLWESGDYTMYITIAGIQFYGTFSID